jgi:hypothetical protein
MCLGLPPLGSPFLGHLASSQGGAHFYGPRERAYTKPLKKPMSEKADKFRRFAEEARQRVEKSVNDAEKERWIKIAEGWEKLANDAEKRPFQDPK